jgi:hypothetical protein
MNCRIQLEPNKNIPPVLQKTKLTKSRPFAFFRGDYNREAGVYTITKHHSSRQAFFYPASIIESDISKKGGREGYVYREGFADEKILNYLKSEIAAEVPSWQPQLLGPESFLLEQILVIQPGVDLWRMLCFALDHAPSLEDNSAPENFINHHAAPRPLALHISSTGLVLYTGNHRALFALASGLTTIGLNRVYIPSRAVNFISAVRNNLDYVNTTFGSKGILALAESCIRGLAEEG